MRKTIVILFAAALLLGVSGNAWAQQDATQKRLYHTVEYTDLTDDQAVVGGGAHNGPNPGQVILTTVSDFPGAPKPMNSLYDYDQAANTRQVDALANRGDAYFWMVKNNTADLLVSFEGDPVTAAPGGVTAVWWESIAGVRRPMWVHDSLSNQAPNNPDANFFDLDALETYGPGDADDANECSFAGDPAGFSVWDYSTPPTGWVPQASIVTAITSLGWTGNPDFVDVDALMVSKYEDEIIFSIRSTGNWHGGELVVMPVSGPAGASFLNHGGHLWDNVFQPSVAFGVPTNEVDAIEAWGLSETDPPEPGEKRAVPSLTNWGLLILLVLLILSGVYVIYHRRRGAVRA